MTQSKKFIFWCLASQGKGISGGDRIYIELAKRWSKNFPIKLITWAEGVGMMNRNGLRGSSQVDITEIFVPIISFLSEFFNYLFRILLGIATAWTMHLDSPSTTYLYTASEFWMDSLPSFILKLRYPSLCWIATWFQTAPSPIKGFSSGGRSEVYRLNALILWLTQLPIRPIIAKYADWVLVNNDLEKSVFPKQNKVNRALVLLGAVDVESINSWLKSTKLTNKKYAAVFQGRFHPQKGVLELIDIWKLVTQKIPYAKLALIGDGQLMSQTRKKVLDLGLQDNVVFFGFLFDGPAKYRVMSQSQLVVHPAYFDSGGMASAEAMAFGLPCVGFDLPAYASYYPQGMIKAPKGDLKAFSTAILGLLTNEKDRIHLGRIAKEYISSNYTWNIRADQILSQLTV